MIPLPSRRRPPLGLLANAWVLILPLAAGAAIPLVNSRIALELELVLAGGAIGFAIFYRLVRDELTLVSALGAYLVALASLFVTLNTLRVIPNADVSDVLLLAGGAVLLAEGLIEHSSWPLYPKSAIVGVAVLALAVALTTGFEPGSGASTGVFFLIGAAVTPLVVAAGTRSRTALLITTLLWLASGALNGVVAGLDIIHVLHVGAITPDGRVEAFTDQPNHLGLACAMVIPVGLALFVGWRHVALRGAVVVLTVCAAAGVLLSGSRSATLGALFGVVMVPVLGYRRRLQTVLLSLAALGCAALVYAVSASFFVSLERLTGQLPVAGADIARLDNWQQAFAQVASSPILGSGFSSLLTAHDLALQLLVSGGVIALVGYSLFAGGIVVIGIHCSRASALDRQISMLSAGFTSSVILFLVSGLVSNEIFDRFIYWPFGLLVAVYFMSRRAAPIRGLDTSRRQASHDVLAPARAERLPSCEP